MSRFLTLLVFLFVTTCLSGCITRTVVVQQPGPAIVAPVPAPIDPNAPTCAIIAFVDTTESINRPARPGKTPWQTAMEDQLTVVFNLIKDLPSEAKPWVEIYGIGGRMVNNQRVDLVQVYKDLPASWQAVLPQMQKMLADGPATEKGTYFAPVLDKLAERAQKIASKYPTVPVVALYLSDGGVDDLEAAIKAGKEAYPQCGNVLYSQAAPVKDDMRERLDKVYGPFQADERFDYSSTLDFGEGRRKLMEALSKPLSSGSSSTTGL